MFIEQTLEGPLRSSGAKYVSVLKLHFAPPEQSHSRVFYAINIWPLCGRDLLIEFQRRLNQKTLAILTFKK
jgi:hypothetical protein